MTKYANFVVFLCKILCICVLGFFYRRLLQNRWPDTPKTWWVGAPWWQIKVSTFSRSKVKGQVLWFFLSTIRIYRNSTAMQNIYKNVKHSLSKIWGYKHLVSGQRSQGHKVKWNLMGFLLLNFVSRTPPKPNTRLNSNLVGEGMVIGTCASQTLSMKGQRSEVKGQDQQFFKFVK